MVPQNIKFIKQLSHSHELSPVEHIRDEIREKHFHNKAFLSMDDVEDALCVGLNNLKNNHHYGKSLTNLPFLNNDTLYENKDYRFGIKNEKRSLDCGKGCYY
jgi:hypothetical protein